MGYNPGGVDRDYVGSGLGRIDQDAARFRGILRGKFRGDLKKHIGNGELIGRQGKDLISIPIPQIELPTFRFGNGQGGVGQGEGEKGAPLGPGNGQRGGEAGDQEGQHILEVEVDEILDIIEEDVELDNLKPSKQGNINGGYKNRSRGVTHVPGPGFLPLRSYKNALRQFPDDPATAIVMSRARPHRRFRSSERIEVSTARGVIIFIGDVSGSMGDEKKFLMRNIAGIYRLLLRRHYPSLEWRFIAHDASAAEVDEETFFHVRESGGTRISSGLELCRDIIMKDYVDDDWNIFVVDFSDGENWDDSDDKKCVDLLEQKLLAKIRSFGFVQVQGSDEKFIGKMDGVGDRSGGKDGRGDVRSIRVKKGEDVLEAVRTICGKKGKTEAGLRKG